jgi:hypothetical protein
MFSPQHKEDTMITVSPKQLQDNATELLRCALDGEYPVMTDPGPDPGVKVAVLTLLIRAAASRTDVGVDALLHTAAEIIVPGLAEGTLSANEAVTAGDVLTLARPDVSLAEHYDRAVAYADDHDLAEVLALLSVGVQLLQYIEQICPGVLTDIAYGVAHLGIAQ